MQKISPAYYNIRISPDFEAFEFSGRVEILFKAVSSIETIQLNILDMEISACRLIQDEKIIDCVFSADPGKEMLAIVLPQAMSGAIRVAIEYQGKINDRMAGFYRSKYVVKAKQNI